MELATLMRAFLAYQREDWDGVAATLAPILPSFPTDDGPHTDTPQRRVFARTLDALAMPPALTAYGRQTLARASDRQLQDVTGQIVAFGDALLGVPHAAAG